MNISEQALEFLEGWESCRLQAYCDSANKLTIGIGHLLTDAELKTELLLIGERLVRWQGGLTRAQAIALKHQDLERFVEAVREKMKTCSLKPHEFDALVIYAFNIGVPAFERVSSVPRLIREGQIERAMVVWQQWNKETRNGKKVVSRGLTKRRKAEIQMFLKADYSGRP